ncbi:MAG: 50S ribosomal protein L10 [Armatimonadetes bacterium]|nr:50S ribosomal protein L10 [Armatimonadota bacterium]MBM3739967.1 50S ribosomal protein L10 [Acidobacteriota bacterium]
MKKKADKQADVAALNELFKNTPHVFVTGFEALTVSQDYALRKTVREAGGLYQVVKNTLAEKAAAGTPAESVMQGLTHMTSIAYTAGDPVALAKALTKYAKDNPKLKFKAGMVEGRAFDVKSIDALANMPSREEILAKLLYLINAPAQRLVTAINGVGRNLAVVIDQGCKENKFSA